MQGVLYLSAKSGDHSFCVGSQICLCLLKTARCIYNIYEARLERVKFYCVGSERTLQSKIFGIAVSKYFEGIQKRQRKVNKLAVLRIEHNATMKLDVIFLATECLVL